MHGLERDHYETLGVARDASQEDIKRAYRAKASRAHPDRDGGDADEMQRLNDAYKVLSDEAARAAYDATGESMSASQMDAKAFDMAATAVVGAIERGDLRDPLNHARREISAVIHQHTNAVREMEKHADRFERALKRLSSKGETGGGRIGAILHEVSRGIRQKIAHAKLEIDTLRAAQRMLDEYDWLNDPALPTGPLPTGQGPQTFLPNW